MHPIKEEAAVVASSSSNGRRKEKVNDSRGMCVGTLVALAVEVNS